MLSLLSCFVPFILAFAGLSKLSAWDEFVVYMAELVGVGRMVADVFAVSVVVIEVVPLIIFILRRPRLANLISICLLLAATSIWFAVWLHTEKPNCACFGQWSKYTLVADGVAGVLVRNTALLFPAILFLVLEQRRSHGEANRMASAPSIHAH